MASMSDVLEFLKKNEYIITIKKTKGGIEMKLPAFRSKFLSRPERNVKVLIKYGKNPRITLDDGSGDKLVIAVPEYTIRSYITAIVMQQCYDLGFNNDLVLIDGTQKAGIEGLETILKPPKSKEKEAYLTELMKDLGRGVSMDECIALSKKLEIAEGFKMIIDLLKSNQGE
jgi:hypothetical protein